MLIDTKPTIQSVSYSQITKKLTIKYSDNNIVEYNNVPNEIYESIINNGKLVSDFLKESLENNYKKTTLV